MAGEPDQKHVSAAGQECCGTFEAASPAPCDGTSLCTSSVEQSSSDRQVRDPREAIGGRLIDSGEARGMAGRGAHGGDCI